MEIDLATSARSRTDEELLRTVERDHAQYTAEALDAARAELRARGVSWTEPSDHAAIPATDNVRRSPHMMILGWSLFLPAALAILWFGVSIATVALMVPGAAILLRAMNQR